MNRIVAVLVLTGLAMTGSLCAQGKGKGRGKGQDRRDAAAVTFIEQDRRLILDYYGPGTGHLPPGLAKRGGNLPPGLQKQLQRNGALPPGLQKKIEPFPPDLAARLTPLPPGYRRSVVGTTALLIHDATNLVVDIIELARR